VTMARCSAMGPRASCRQIRMPRSAPDPEHALRPIAPKGAFELTAHNLVGLTCAAQNRRMAQRVIVVPRQIGPCQFGELGAMIAVRCPHDYNGIMRKAGAQWGPGSKRWLIERRRIGPVIRALERATDPLFRRQGIVLE
jgi:hypothetical protein